MFNGKYSAVISVQIVGVTASNISVAKYVV